MSLIDILIFVISIAGLIYFFLDRIKYSNKNTYYKKLERLYELEKEIHRIELHNSETEVLINNMNIYMDFDDGIADKLIKYRDDSGKLETLKNERIKISSYLLKSRLYIKEFF
jgi:hypothetical protein